MDANYWRHSIKNEPKFNEKVCGGYVTEELKDVDIWLDKVIRSISQTFPKSLRYKGLVQLTPTEQYNSLRNGNKKVIYDFAETDVFTVKLMFELHTQKGIESVEHLLQLPFCRPGNMIKIKGSMATLSPVIADRFMSVTTTGLFFIIQKAKFPLDKLDYTVVRDEDTFTGSILKAPLFNKPKSDKKNKTGNKGKDEHILATTGHYIFSNFGVTEAFRKYYNTDVHICKLEDVDKYYDSDLHYVIHSKHKSDESIDYALIVDKTLFNDNKGFVNLVMSFFYITDKYKNYMHYGDIDLKETWLKTLAFAIWNEFGDLNNYLVMLDDHMLSLEDYIDPMTKEIIIEESINNEQLMMIDSIYDLLIFANNNVDKLMKETDIGSMWGKYLIVKRYVLSDILAGINKLVWSFPKRQNDKRELSVKSIKSMLNTHIKRNTFDSISSNHGEKTNVQYAGDNYIYKYTSPVVRQIDAVMQGNKGKKQLDVSSPEYHLHPSIFDCGCIVNFSKKNMDGRCKLNPFICLTEDGKIIPNPVSYEMLMALAEEIKPD